MRVLPSLHGDISPLTYAVCAPALLLSQHAMVAVAYKTTGSRLHYDSWFWLLPLRRLAEMPDISTVMAAGGFAVGLIVAWGLALLSFRRALRTNFGYPVAALAIVPGFQIIAVLTLLFAPRRPKKAVSEPEELPQVRHIVGGVLAGVALIVVAVILSALTFGAYGWGLFVATPFLVGIATGFLVNRGDPLSSDRTSMLVLWAAALGALALIMLSLEGLACVLLAAPLGGAVAVVGGAFGRAAAMAVQRRQNPLLSVALLPALFAVEAALPPALQIQVEQTIDIAAPPASVWRALTSEEPIREPPGLVGRAGLAYPLRSRLAGDGVGSLRLGSFSTGVARERVTEWLPGRRLAFVVIDQPPAMEEMSPYRRVRAPHVEGYFDTLETSFHLQPLGLGRTRLTVSAAHVLRIEPVLYWEPIARWAIGENVSRVLRDIRIKAEEEALRR